MQVCKQQNDGRTTLQLLPSKTYETAYQESLGSLKNRIHLRKKEGRKVNQWIKSLKEEEILAFFPILLGDSFLKDYQKWFHCKNDEEKIHFLIKYLMRALRTFFSRGDLRTTYSITSSSVFVCGSKINVLLLHHFSSSIKPIITTG